MSKNVGTGPGEITNDGCAVEFYALLPAFGEADIVHGSVPAGASILELGCGAGRILKPLAGLGHPVHGVDDSAGMLAYLDGIPTTRSPIESARLGQKFEGVLLASMMLNTEPVQRRLFLATVGYHLADGGAAVFQYNPPGWYDTFSTRPRQREQGGVIATIRKSVLVPPAAMECEMEYQANGQTWTHAWTSHKITDEELSADLATAGLAFGRWLTDDQAWFTARRTA